MLKAITINLLFGITGKNLTRRLEFFPRNENERSVIMNNKKFALLGLAGLVMSLASCGGGGSTNYDLSYWCPSVDNAVMEQLVKDFKAANPDYAKKSIGRKANYGEGETSAPLIKSLSKAADVMLMADDNIRGCVDADVVADLTDDKVEMTTEMGLNAVEACSIDGNLYGYPYRADNSPMPFYDKTMFSGANAAKLGSLEGMLEVAKANNAKVYLDMGNGWYNPFLLWSKGGEFGISKKTDGGLEIATNFGNQSAETKARRGEIAAFLDATKALYNEYYADTWVSSSDDSEIEKGFKEGSIAVAFLWNDINNIQAANANVSVATWPTLTVGGTPVKLHCFQSYKAVVCKKNSDAEQLAFAKAFAKFLAGEHAQTMRAEQLQYGPSDISVAATFTAEELPFSTAINTMALAGLTHSQATRTTGDFWTPMANLGSLVTNKTSGWGAFGTANRALENLCSQSGWSLTAVIN